MVVYCLQLGSMADSQVLGDKSDDEQNPFLTLGAEDDLFSNDLTSSTLKPRLPRPNWGIPSFEDQCNGINTFTLFRFNEQDNYIKGAQRDSIIVELEHRRNSTGSDLWEAALVLAHALDRPMPEDGSDDRTVTTSLFREARSVIELGSGTGALGLYAAHVLGARAVALTDLMPNLDLLRSNSDRNASTRIGAAAVEVFALDWIDTTIPLQLVKWKDSEAPAGVDLILGSDLFLPFAPHLLDSLARTIRDLMHQLGHADTQAVLAYEERFDCSLFYKHAKGYGLIVEQIDNTWLHPVYQDPGRIYVLRIRRIKVTK